MRACARIEENGFATRKYPPTERAAIRDLYPTSRPAAPGPDPPAALLSSRIRMTMMCRRHCMAPGPLRQPGAVISNLNGVD